MSLTRVLSVVRGVDPGAAQETDTALDLNAYALADDIELTLVLKAAGVELAVNGARAHPYVLAGVTVPAAEPADDVRALLASGVNVLAVEEDVMSRGLVASDLVAGVSVVPEVALADEVVAHDVVLVWGAA